MRICIRPHSGLYFMFCGDCPFQLILPVSADFSRHGSRCSFPSAACGFSPFSRMNCSVCTDALFLSAAGRNSSVRRLAEPRGDGKIRRENRLFVSWMFFNRGMVPAPEMPLKKGDRERECRIPEMSETAYMLHPAWLSAVFPFLSSVFPDSAPFRCGKFRLFLASGTE